MLVIAGYFSYRGLGSDLLPEMDEGAFVLDYFTPAGTSLTETNRILEHVDQILHRIPEVSITSRRTGLQMGLAAVTEANTGDFTVRLKTDRSRDIDEVIADAREQIHAAEPSLDMEFTQVLQDMIGDLSNSPEPIQIKLFSNDHNLLLTLGPRVQQAIAKIPGVVDTQNGVDNTISGPATNFQIDPVVAGRLGFTPTEVAEDATSILDGLPTNDPLISGGRPYTIRVRLPDANRASLEAIENTVFNSSSGHTATLGAMATVTQLPPQNEIRRENLQQVILVSGRLEGSDLGGAMAAVQNCRRRASAPILCSRRIRGHLPGAAKIVCRSGPRSGAGACPGFRRTAGRVPQLCCSHRNSYQFCSFPRGRGICFAYHGHGLQCSAASWASSWSSGSWPRTAFCCSTRTSSCVPAEWTLAKPCCTQPSGAGGPS